MYQKNIDKDFFLNFQVQAKMTSTSYLFQHFKNCKINVSTRIFKFHFRNKVFGQKSLETIRKEL